MHQALAAIFLVAAASNAALQVSGRAEKPGSELNFERAVRLRCDFLAQHNLQRYTCQQLKSHSDRPDDTTVGFEELPSLAAVPMNEFHSAMNWKYARGNMPYILRGAILSNGSMSASSPRRLSDLLKHGRHTAFSMLDLMLGASINQNIDMMHPWRAVQHVFEQQAGNCSEMHAAQYMSTSTGHARMEALLHDVPRAVLRHRFESHDVWLDFFFGDHPRIREGLEAGTPWQILLLGCAGRGFEIHSDDTPTAAWQVQLAGSKAWVICPPLQAEEPAWHDTQDETDDVFAWRYEATRTAMGEAGCTFGMVHQGDAIYYPPHWLHATLNWSPWSVGLSMHQLSVPEVPELVQHLSTKINTFRARMDDAASTDIDFLPLTATARAAAPLLFEWWIVALAGRYAHTGSEDDTCSPSDASATAELMARLATRYADEDEAELGLL